MRNPRWIFFAVGLLFGARHIHSQEGGPYSVGLIYPGVSLRWRATPSYAVELRGESSGGVRALGLRGYRFGRVQGKLTPFLGVEADWLGFDTDGVKGDGRGFVVFAGGDYFFHPRFSLQLDLGAGWLELREKAGAQSANGVEFVLNTGVYFHWGKSGADK